VCGFCLRWHIADGEVAKMTDEERRELIAYLRNPGHDFRGDKALAEEIIVAANEIERLGRERDMLSNALCLCRESERAQAAEIERLATIISGNVRLVEELDDGAIFEIRHLRGS
jgi:DNA primase catalytic subunit